MIIDMHTHVGVYPDHISEEYNASQIAGLEMIYHGKIPPGVKASVTLEEHYEGVKGVDRVVALGFQSHTFGWFIPNDYVAEYQQRYPDKVAGFCSVDPNDPNAVEELERCHSDLKLKGIKLGPPYQSFDPVGEPAMRLYERAEALNMPILIHQGATYIRTAPLRIGMPMFLDEVGLRFPNLRVIIAHMGHPWFLDTVALIRQRPNFYADISAMYYRPWQFYSALAAAYEYNVTGKLLFGSDYPSVPIDGTMAALRSVNDSAVGGMPRVPEDVIEAIISENAERAFGDLWE